MGEAKPIGELNGGWALLLKILLGSYPFLLAWASWVTVNVIVLSANEFTSSDGYQLQATVSTAIQQHNFTVDNRLRPIEQLVVGAGILPKTETKIEALERRLALIESGFAAEHGRLPVARPTRSGTKPMTED